MPKSIVITVERAKDLRDMSSLGRMDPYAEVIYGVHSRHELRKQTRPAEAHQQGRHRNEVAPL